MVLAHRSLVFQLQTPNFPPLNSEPTKSTNTNVSVIAAQKAYPDLPTSIRHGNDKRRGAEEI